MRKSDAQTGFDAETNAALAQSNWQVQRGKLSGPNSHVASKSQWMSLQASFSAAPTSGPFELPTSGTVPIIFEVVDGDCVAIDDVRLLIGLLVRYISNERQS